MRHDTGNAHRGSKWSVLKASMFDEARIVIDGKSLHGLRINCGNPICSATEVARLNTFKSARGGDDTDVALRQARRKFTNLGWVVGATQQGHRCPRCVDRKAFREAIAVETAKMVNVVTIATPPKTMGRDDRRVIFAKLNDVYESAATGYAAPWTDAKVAQDLGVPRAWVAEVREEMFGPVSSNNEIDETLASADGLLGEMRDLAKKLTDRADHIEKKLVEIKKAVRP